MLDGVVVVEQIEQKDGTFETVEKRDASSLRAIFLSEEDRVVKTNQNLEEAGLWEYQVWYSTFRRYKKMLKDKVSIETLNGSDQEALENFKELWTVIQKALVKQKELLFTAMLDSPSNHWQKYARILERKFDSWNIKQKTEDVNETKKLNLALLNEQSKALEVWDEYS